MLPPRPLPFTGHDHQIEWSNHPACGWDDINQEEGVQIFVLDLAVPHQGVRKGL